MASKAARGASNLLWVIAGLTLVLGGVTVFTLGVVPWVELGAVVLFAVLGFLVRRGSVAALWVGTIAYSLDAVATVIVGLAAGDGLPISTLVIKGILIVGLVRALSAMRTVQAV